MATGASKFLATTSERSDMNQYWYSANSIETLVAEALECEGPVAFVSTPSLYLSIPESIRRARDYRLLDFDQAFKVDPGFSFYDFRKPAEIDPQLLQRFAGVVIDPPFITEEVWRAYAETSRALLLPGDSGRVLATTIAENAPLMLELFKAKPQRWQPSIPHLVYQYACYANYDTVRHCCSCSTRA